MLQIHNTVYTIYKKLLYNTTGTNTLGEQKAVTTPKGINIDEKKEKLLKLMSHSHCKLNQFKLNQVFQYDLLIGQSMNSSHLIG